MKKYNISICSCGRIHAISNQKIDAAIANNQKLILICGNCGQTTIIEAERDIETDGYILDTSKSLPKNKSVIIDKTMFIDELNKTDKSINCIIYDRGYPVMMMTGEYANEYFNSTFADNTCPDFSTIQKKNITVDEIMDFINTYKKNRTTINMQRFIRETPDEIISELRCYPWF